MLLMRLMWPSDKSGVAQGHKSVACDAEGVAGPLPLRKTRPASAGSGAMPPQQALLYALSLHRERDEPGGASNGHRNEMRRARVGVPNAAGEGSGLGAQAPRSVGAPPAEQR